MDRPLEKLELEGGGMEVPRTGTEERELEEEGGMDIPLVGTEVVLLEMYGDIEMGDMEEMLGEP